MSYVIAADEIKKTLPDYSPDKAELFHRESARLADKEFYKQLKESSYKKVILLCGGSASGKTEFLSDHLIRKRCIIFDATLSSEEGAKIKIRSVLNAKKIPIIYAVIPDDLNRAFIAFLNRDRKFGDEHFYKTHSGSRKTLLWIVQNYPDIELNIIESSYTRNQELRFAKLVFRGKVQLLEYLTSLQLTEADIISRLTS